MKKRLTVEAGFRYFLIESKGYKKQLTSQVQSRRSFSIIEKKAKERGEPVLIKLFGKANIEDEWTILDLVEIGEVYYE